MGLREEVEQARDLLNIQQTEIKKLRAAIAILNTGDISCVQCSLTREQQPCEACPNYAIQQRIKRG